MGALTYLSDSMRHVPRVHGMIYNVVTTARYIHYARDFRPSPVIP
jgi:hypothetical protein